MGISELEVIKVKIVIEYLRTTLILNLPKLQTRAEYNATDIQ